MLFLVLEKSNINSLTINVNMHLQSELNIENRIIYSGCLLLIFRII